MEMSFSVKQRAEGMMLGRDWESNHVGPPYLSAAVICRQVEEDEQGGINLHHLSTGSVVSGYLEEFGIRLANPGDSLILWLSLFSGAMGGESTVIVRLVSPSGLVTGQFTHPFKSRPGNYSVAIPLEGLVVFEEGVHRFEIGLDGALVTKVPYEVVHAVMSRA
jgi:hypothetical protein